MTQAFDTLSLAEATPASAAARAGGASLAIMSALSLSHGLNDLIQSLLPAIYPLLKESYALDFSQVGLITLAFQGTASILQPLVGIYTDKYPKPYSLAVGMTCTLCGLLLLSVAWSYPVILVAAMLVGFGSSIFHPESSRMARVASGGKHGFAQSLFQVGGNTGSAIGPLLAAFIVVPHGQKSIAWFSLVALFGIIVLFNCGRWYSARLKAQKAKGAAPTAAPHAALRNGVVVRSLAILIALMFSKFVYLAAMGTYLTFYLQDRFKVDVQQAQIYLFIYLFAVAAGTFLGGPIGDRFGRKPVIWASIAGVLPFTLLLPHVNLFWTVALTIPIGLVLASAFSAIVVFAQDLVPGRTGMIAGMFFGFAFGMGGVGAAALGEIADRTSIEFVFQLCAFLPALGLLAAFLPNIKHAH
jgi:MFS transporter, FSR family, fosmidomycin resistance protein